MSRWLKEELGERQERIRELEKELEKERARVRELQGEIRPDIVRVVDEADEVERIRGALYSTFFRAAGTMGRLGELLGAGLGESPGLINEFLDEDFGEDFAAPAAFYSNMGEYLGQVKWEGVVDWRVLIGRLNQALQFVGEERGDFDFRLVYESWSWKWEVVERIGGVDFVVAEREESSG